MITLIGQRGFSVVRGFHASYGCDTPVLHRYSDGTDPAQGPYGTPQVDTVRFPDMKAMVAKAHKLGLRAGWYRLRTIMITIRITALD
jgi:hypothetical protein